MSEQSLARAAEHQKYLDRKLDIRERELILREREITVAEREMANREKALADMQQLRQVMEGIHTDHEDADDDLPIMSARGGHA